MPSLTNSHKDSKGNIYRVRKINDAMSPFVLECRPPSSDYWSQIAFFFTEAEASTALGKYIND